MRTPLRFSRFAWMVVALAFVSGCAVASEVDVAPRDATTDRAATEGGNDVVATDTPPTDTSRCAASQTECAGQCVDTRSDGNNCGACGTACATGQFCDNGACAVSCNAPRTICGATCTDTATDVMNCGACGTACGAMQSCMAGVCTCPAATMLCGTTCIDVSADPMNCGACGTACAAVQRCVGGACVCPGGGMFCSGACVDAMNDAMNCGACGNACAAGQMCDAGACACPTGQTTCGGACVDTRVDTANCGSCGHACGTGQFCSVGTCFCPAGRVLCGGACVDVNTDANNCGTCGTVCPGGAPCTAGSCVCPGGASACSGACVNLQTDNNNCGMCGRVCMAPAMCSSGVCATITNDDCATATPVTLAAGTTTTMVNTVGATPSTSSCGGSDAWIAITLTTQEIVYVDTFGSTFDTRVGIANTCGSAATCNDNACAGTQSQVAAILSAGTHYIVVGGTSTGVATVHIQHVPIAPTTAASIGTSFNVTGNTTGAPGMTGACGQATATPSAAFYWLTCPSTPAGTLSATTCTGVTLFDTVLQNQNGDGSAGTCNDDALSCSWLQSSISTTIAG